MNSRRLGDRARSGLASTRFARLDWVAETGSTQADLLASAASGELAERALVADFQSAGRGRRGRAWTTVPEAALMVSVLVRPGPLDLAPTQLGRLTMAFAVAAAEACRDRYEVPVGLKWPNDLVATPDGRKLAGILAETTGLGTADAAVVIGMGLNANGPLPEEVADTGVTLAELAGQPVDREDLLVEVLSRFDAALGDLAGSADVPLRYRRLSVTIGQAVRVVLEEGHVDAEAVDIDDDGHLLIDPGTGELVPVAAGDVVHLRPR